MVVAVHVAEMEIPRTHVVPQLTVDELLANQAMIDVNMACSSRISANIAILKEATGITYEDIYRLPAVFTNFNISEYSTAEQPLKVRAYYPGLINGIMLSEPDYLSPKPWSPLVGGKDVFEEAANTQVPTTQRRD